MAVEWMTILTSAAVLLLILFIIFILLRANHDLARAQEEGEHFVDEWAEREEKLEEKRRRRKAREEQLMQMEEERQEAEDPGPDLYGQTGQEFRKSLLQGSTDGLTLLELDQSKNILRRIPVDHIPFRIGRSGENDLVLEDLCVSRQHISIENRQGQLVAVDLGTRNKIFCEGRLVNQLVLKPGLHFLVGNVELAVERNR